MVVSCQRLFECQMSGVSAAIINVSSWGFNLWECLWGPKSILVIRFYFILFAELLHPNSVTMSNGESPSNSESLKKRKLDDTDGSEDDSEDGYERSCFTKVYTNTEGRSSEWICENIPFTEYLKTFKPERKVTKVIIIGFIFKSDRVLNDIVHLHIIKFF